MAGDLLSNEDADPVTQQHHDNEDPGFAARMSFNFPEMGELASVESFSRCLESKSNIA